MDPQVLDLAFRACGSIEALAQAVGVGGSTPAMWKARGKVPAEHCAAIELATRGAVTRKDLRPGDWRRIWPELAKRAA